MIAVQSVVIRMECNFILVQTWSKCKNTAEHSEDFVFCGGAVFLRCGYPSAVIRSGKLVSLWFIFVANGHILFGSHKCLFLECIAVFAGVVLKREEAPLGF